MSAANPNSMEKSMVLVLVVANAGGGGSPLLCGVDPPFPVVIVMSHHITSSLHPYLSIPIWCPLFFFFSLSTIPQLYNPISLSQCRAHVNIRKSHNKAKQSKRTKGIKEQPNNRHTLVT
jgi:hypothetical protein